MKSSPSEDLRNEEQIVCWPDRAARGEGTLELRTRTLGSQVALVFGNSSGRSNARRSRRRASHFGSSWLWMLRRAKQPRKTTKMNSAPVAPLSPVFLQTKSQREGERRKFDHSCRNETAGSMCAARNAGPRPATTPTDVITASAASKFLWSAPSRPNNKL
jgi:hypothetical protein